jgi:hypothetical protein
MNGMKIATATTMIIILIIVIVLFLLYKLERHMLDHAVEGWEDKYGTVHFEQGHPARQALNRHARAHVD